MPDELDKPLITAVHPGVIRPGSRPGRILAGLHAARVVYHFRQDGERGRAIAGSGQFFVEITGGELRCRVLGDLFKPGPFEFVFHRFWLTRRGMILAALDLAGNRPPSSPANSGEFLHFTDINDPAIRREAAAWRKQPKSGEQRSPT